MEYNTNVEIDPRGPKRAFEIEMLEDALSLCSRHQVSEIKFSLVEFYWQFGFGWKKLSNNGVTSTILAERKTEVLKTFLTAKKHATVEQINLDAAIVQVYGQDVEDAG